MNSEIKQHFASILSSACPIMLLGISDIFLRRADNSLSFTTPLLFFREGCRAPWQTAQILTENLVNMGPSVCSVTYCQIHQSIFIRKRTRANRLEGMSYGNGHFWTSNNHNDLSLNWFHFLELMTDHSFVYFCVKKFLEKIC